MALNKKEIFYMLGKVSLSSTSYNILILQASDKMFLNFDNNF